MNGSWRVFCAMVLAMAGVISAGCATAWRTPLKLPDRHTLVREQLVFHSDFQIPVRHRLIEELIARRGDVSRRLGLVLSDEPINVYLFEDNEQFEGYIWKHHPEYPERRAFFVKTDTRLVVYVQWGDRVAEDLRHEVTHGYLHSVVPNLPLWLDEGLAEYFEVARGRRGLNRAHLDLLGERLQRGDWQPDLGRLARLDPRQEMTLDQYAEAWAWVHFLLESRPEHGEILRTYLRQLQSEESEGATEPISSRLRRLPVPPERLLIDHVQRLAARAGARR